MTNYCLFEMVGARYSLWSLTSYPGSRWMGKERAWYPLFAHALNFPEIVNYLYNCDIIAYTYHYTICTFSDQQWSSFDPSFDLLHPPVPSNSSVFQIEFQLWTFGVEMCVLMATAQWAGKERRKVCMLLIFQKSWESETIVLYPYNCDIITYT